MAPAASGPAGERRKSERRRLVGSLLALDAAVLLVVVLATDAVRIWLEGILQIWPLVTVPLLLALARGVLLGYWPLLDRREIYGSGEQLIVLWLVSQNVSTRLALRGALALVAVLRGQVSLVGPRPIRYGDVLGKALAHGLATVQPGLTGPWRIGGAEATLEEQTIEDLAYVRNYSIWEDLRIIGQTLWRSAQTGRRSLGRWEAAAQPLFSMEPRGLIVTHGEAIHQ